MSIEAKDEESEQVSVNNTVQKPEATDTTTDTAPRHIPLQSPPPENTTTNAAHRSTSVISPPPEDTTTYTASRGSTTQPWGTVQYISMSPWSASSAASVEPPIGTLHFVTPSGTIDEAFLGYTYVQPTAPQIEENK